MMKVTNKTENNIFNLFPKYNLEQVSPASNQQITTTDIKDSVEIKESKSRKGKKILFGSTLATSIIACGVASMFLVKGFHSSSFTKLERFGRKIAENLQKNAHNQNGTIANNVVYYSRKGTKTTIDTLQATSNFTAIKDWFVDKLLRTNKATSKFADKSKSMFKKIVDKTLGKKYDKAGTKVKDLTSLLQQYKLKQLSQMDKSQIIEIKGQSLTLGEWLEKLANQTSQLDKAYEEGFSRGARELRNQKRSDLLSNINKKLDNEFGGISKIKKFIKDKKYKTYITETVTNNAKQELQNDIIKAKKEVTNNIDAIHDSLKNHLHLFSSSIKPADTASLDKVQLLKAELEAFKNCSGANESELRKKVSDKIYSLTDDAIKLIKDNSLYSQKEKESLIKELKTLANSASVENGGSKCALEEIMTILTGLSRTNKNIVSDKELKEYNKLAKQIRQNINKATNLEIDEYFLKQAELEVGSAPTDILSVLFPVGVGAYSIAKGDDKEEKISATLTTCIPLVGTFATFVYGTTKMFSGAKNLIFSAISGLLLSKAGNYADKLYKKYKDTGSVVQVAKEETDKIWTDLKPKYAQSAISIQNNVK